MVTLRLAVAHSVLGDGPRALDYFRRAGSIAPESLDVRHYRGMHHLRSGERERAEPLFAEVLARSPERLSALEALARIRREQGRLAEAAGLVERTVALRRDPAPALLELGELRMALGDTPGALRAFERARELQGEGFTGWLELGVLYLADRRLAEARDSLDRVPPAHPDFPLALFKRAQVSVLLGEPDAEARIRLAREHADATSGPLIDNEPLFSALSPGRGRGPSSPP
jgi:tetratricopeptide (TPR) repeat protein